MICLADSHFGSGRQDGAVHQIFDIDKCTGCLSAADQRQGAAQKSVQHVTYPGASRADNVGRPDDREGDAALIAYLRHQVFGVDLGVAIRDTASDALGRLVQPDEVAAETKGGDRREIDETLQAVGAGVQQMPGSIDQGLSWLSRGL